MTTISNKPEKSIESRRVNKTGSASVAYSVAWIAGLSVTSVATDVTSAATTVLQKFSSDQSGIILQFLLTQGLAALALLFVLKSFWRVASGQQNLARTTIGSGITGAMISLLQCAAGIWLATVVVQARDASTADFLKDSINRIDGVKMFAFAIMACSGTLLLRRQKLVPLWLQAVGVVLTVSITVSGVGYVLLNSFLAYAAWVSLPLLLIWVTGTGLALSHLPAK